MSILLRSIKLLKRLKLRLYILCFSLVFFAGYSQAYRPCDQLDSLEFQELCDRFLADQDSSGSSLENHYFSTAKILRNNTGLEGLATADDSGAIFVMAQDIIVNLSHQMIISKPIALLGNPNNPPRLEFHFVPWLKKKAAAVLVTRDASRFFVWGINWVAASGGPTRLLNLYQFMGEAWITHCTFHNTAPERSFENFVVSYPLWPDAKVTFSNNRCYTNRLQRYCFSIISFENENSTVNIVNNQWLSSDNDTDPEQGYGVISLINISRAKIIGNKQVSKNSKATIKVAFIGYDTTASDVDITIQDNTAHPDSSLKENRIMLVNAITANGFRLCPAPSGCFNILYNHGYLTCKSGNLDELPGLTINTEEQGDLPDSGSAPETSQVLLLPHGRVMSYRRNHQKVPYCSPSVGCPITSSSVPGSSSGTFSIDLAATTMTASYTPLPTPPSSPEVPNPDEGGGLSPTQTSLLIVGAVIPA
ncbi:MAG: hypothetical protein ACR2PT_18935, partial [Endozoicomonas sp.]